MIPHRTCWHKEAAFEVLNIDAEAIDDAIFRAVHSDRPLSLTQPLNGESDSGELVAPEVFLRRFLDPSRTHVQAAVVGTAGTGKSHFIHWMRLNIPRSEKRLMIAIPRSGTSLRGILQLLIEQLPAASRETYLAKLAEAGSDVLTDAVRLHSLIANTRLALLSMTPDPEDDAAEWLLDNRLALLFQDPFLVDGLAADDGIFAELAQHIGQLRKYSPVDTVRAFEYQDLRLSGADIDRLSEPTREVIPMLMTNARVRERAATLVNAAIPRAISAVLNFSGDQLIELMSDVRRHIGSQGKEIVLLIEDFARLQGIDQALLQALLVQHNSQPELAPLRWAMAVTKGYWDQRVRDTVLERMNFVVDMNAGTREASSTDEQIVRFAARYLNAVRIPRSELRDWAETKPSTPVPNPCIPCSDRESCHTAFEQVDGVGLYPLNRHSINLMLWRRGGRFPEGFNPRSVVGPVLGDVLGNQFDAFADRSFPSEAFLDSLGAGNDLVAADRRAILEAKPGAEGSRYVGIVGLWGDGAASVDDRVLARFGLAPLVREETAKEPEEGDPDREAERIQKEKERVARAEERLPLLDALDRWSGNGPLAERWARTLREYVFDAVCDVIEWDTLGLERSMFAKTTGGQFFTSRKISFKNQETTPEGGLIRLAIPGTEDDQALVDASMALQALVHLREYGTLPVREPRKHHALLAHHLESWKASVQGQIDARLGEPAPDRSRAAARLLLLVAALSGRCGASATAGDWATVAFDEPSVDYPACSEAWRTSSARIRLWQKVAAETYMATSAAMKGGNARAAIDGTAFLLELAQLETAGWTVPALLPTKGSVAFPDLDAALRTAVSTFDAAAANEWRELASWAQATREALPPERSAEDVLPAVARLRRALTQAGAPYTPAKFEHAQRQLSLVEPSGVDDALRSIGELEGLGGVPPLPALADASRARAIQCWATAVTAASSAITDANSALNRLKAEADADLSFESLTEEISDKLKVVVSALEQVEATSGSDR